MVASGSKFTVKPEGTNLRRILITHAMRHESVVLNGHKVFRKCAVGSANGEGIFRTAPLLSNPTYCRATLSLTKFRHSEMVTVASVTSRAA